MAGNSAAFSTHDFQPPFPDRKRPRSSLPIADSQQPGAKLTKIESRSLSSVGDDKTFVDIPPHSVHVSPNFYVAYPYVYTDLVARNIEVDESRFLGDGDLPFLVHPERNLDRESRTRRRCILTLTSSCACRPAGPKARMQCRSRS